MRSLVLITVLALASTAQASGYHRLKVTSRVSGTTETHTVFQSNESRGLLHNVVAIRDGWVCTADFASTQDDTFVLGCMTMKAAVLKSDESRIMAIGTCQDGQTTLTVEGFTLSAQCE